MAFIHAEAASLAVMQLMGTHDLRRVYKAAVNASDGTCRRWWDVESSVSDVEEELV